MINKYLNSSFENPSTNNKELFDILNMVCDKDYKKEEDSDDDYYNFSTLARLTSFGRNKNKGKNQKYINDYLLSFNNWIENNFPNIHINIQQMSLPDNVAGFATKQGVFLNKNFFGFRNFYTTTFAIIHELEHYREYLNIPDELKKAKSEENFELFLNNAIEIEKRVDNKAEIEMQSINIKNGISKYVGIEKQQFDVIDHMFQYKSFMKRIHDIWLENKDKYSDLDEMLVDISVGKIQLDFIINHKTNKTKQMETIKENNKQESDSLSSLTKRNLRIKQHLSIAIIIILVDCLACYFFKNVYPPIVITITAIIMLLINLYIFWCRHNQNHYFFFEKKY